MPIKRLLVLAWLLWTAVAYAAAPTPIGTFCTAAPDQCRKGTVALLAAKGTTDNVEYMAEIDTTTGEIPVKLSGSTTVSLAEDHNYGAVGATTLRGAAQLGNATGPILYGAGASSAQVPRVIVATDSTISAQNFPTTVNTNFGAPGASTIRAAAELGVGGAAVSNANPVPVSDAGGSLTVDATTWPLPTGAATESTLGTLNGKVANDFGAAAAAVRVAAMPGNASGIADFGSGAAGAQTPRAVLATRHESVATPLAAQLSNGSAAISYDLGAPSSATVRAAAMLGVGSTAVSNANPVPVSDAGGSLTVDGSVSASNFPATADTNFGAPGASTLRGAAMLGVGSTAVSNANPVPVSDAGGSLTVDATTWPLPTGAATEATLGTLNGKVTNDFGATAAAVRVAAIPGNASGIADFGSGAAGAQTPRAVLATRHEAVATPLAAQLSNGSAAIDYNLGTPGAATVRAAAMLGVGSTAVSASNPVPSSEQGHTYSDSARNDYSSTNVTSGAWVQLIASTAAAVTRLYIDDTCGQVLELGTGAVASETRKLLIPRGGFSSSVDLAIPASTRVSLRAVSGNCTSGDIVLTGLL